jgi:nucleotide-binding universal stress UspA family protein
LGGGIPALRDAASKENAAVQRPDPPDTSSGPAADPAPLTTPQSPFERLLVPVDFSPSSRVALEAALQIAEQQGSEVVLFHASGFKDTTFLDARDVGWGGTVSEVEQHLRSFAEEVRPGSGARVTVDASQEGGSAVKAIGRAAQRHHTTLAVVGTSDPPRWSRSTAEQIAHVLPCAVLLAREA